MERFTSKFEKRGPDECWPWTAGTNAGGYGWFGFNGRTRLAHRVSWTLNIGEIPEGLHVLHRCDNRPCVNPAHLFLGTQLDNVADRVAKGRSGGGSLCGEDHPRVKLTAEKVAEIRARYVPRVVTQEFLAKEYGVTRGNIHAIVSGKTW